MTTPLSSPPNVERVARALFDDDLNWSRFPEEMKEPHRRKARRVIAALSSTQDTASQDDPELQREYLLLASYCGDDNEHCTEQRPCNDCLAMCNIFDANGSFIRELGSSTDTGDIRAATIERCARMADAYAGNAAFPCMNVIQSLASAIRALNQPGAER